MAESSEFTGTYGVIRWRSWLPQDAAYAVVVLVHGIAEHSGRYAHVAQALANAGYAVYAPDHYGHGRSDGAKANIGSMAGAAADVATMLEIAAERHPGVPRFLVSHSMGSLIVLYLMTQRPVPVAGLVLSAPPLDIPAGNPLQRLAAPLLSQLTPNLGVLSLDSSTVSRDPAVVAAYDTDPLNYHGKVTARTGAEILRATIAVKASLGKLSVPLLVLHGTADRLAAPSSADLIERDAAATDLTVHRYPGLYHEVFNEPEREQVIADVISWLNAHLTPATD